MSRFSLVLVVVFFAILAPTFAQFDRLGSVGGPAPEPEGGWGVPPVGPVNPSLIAPIRCGICETVVGQVDAWSSVLKSGCVASPACLTVKYDCNLASTSMAYDSVPAAMAGGFADDNKVCCCFC